MKPLLWLAAILVAGLARAATPSPLGTLTPPVPGPFPAIPDFKASFAFGWSGIQSAQATAVAKREGKDWHVKVSGGSMGLARTLWQLDATHEAFIDATTLHPISVDQVETYSDRKVTSTIRYSPKDVWYIRDVSVDKGTKARWKQLKIPDVFDILSGVFFVRSMPLKNGDKVRLVCFPDSTPFVGQAVVEGRENVEVMGKTRQAIKLRMEISKIETSHGKPEKLMPYTKFKSGEVWISDDDLRMPLKAKVNVFVGYIYAEITSFDKL